MEVSTSNIKKLYFLKESLFNISGNGNPEKTPYILGNEIFSYFKKPKP